MKNVKEKIIGSVGSVSGVVSILGSWQICHNVCLGLIALLSVVGITVVGMPLAFLTTIAIPIWSFAALLLVITFIIYQKKKCISKNMLIINLGLIIAGIPFAFVQDFKYLLWIVGGILVVFGVYSFISGKIKKRCHNEK